LVNPRASRHDAFSLSLLSQMVCSPNGLDVCRSSAIHTFLTLDSVWPSLDRHVPPPSPPPPPLMSSYASLLRFRSVDSCIGNGAPITLLHAIPASHTSHTFRTNRTQPTLCLLSMFAFVNIFCHFSCTFTFTLPPRSSARPPSQPLPPSSPLSLSRLVFHTLFRNSACLVHICIPRPTFTYSNCSITSTRHSSAPRFSHYMHFVGRVTPFSTLDRRPSHTNLVPDHMHFRLS
jgi:hypothetical protein